MKFLGARFEKLARSQSELPTSREGRLQRLFLRAKSDFLSCFAGRLLLFSPLAKFAHLINLWKKFSSHAPTSFALAFTRTWARPFTRPHAQPCARAGAPLLGQENGQAGEFPVHGPRRQGGFFDGRLQ